MGVISIYDDANQKVGSLYGDIDGGRIDLYNDDAAPDLRFLARVVPTTDHMEVRWYNSANAFSRLTYYDSGDTDITGLIGGSTSGTLIEGVANAHVVVGLRGNDAGDCFAIVKDETNGTGLGSYDNRLFEIDSTNADFETELRVHDHSLWVYNGSSVNVAKIDNNGWFWSIDANGYRVVMDPVNGFRTFTTGQVMQAEIDLAGQATFQTLILANLPTSSGATGVIWNDSGTLKIS